MLFDQKKHYKAKQYEYIKIQDKDGEGNVLDSFSHLIRPIGSETETVDIDPVQIIRDFITLIGEYTRCTHLQRMINDGPYSYKGIKDKARQNWIANENKYFYREEKQMLNALLTFINKYGLFGLMDDRVMKYDYNRLNDDGSYSDSNYPETAYLYDEFAKQVHAVPYDQYIKPFFPEIPASDAMKLIGEDKARQYSEYMESILQNRRFMDCVNYIAGIDKERRIGLPIYDLNAFLTFRQDIPIYDVKCRSLIQYCHTMFFLNELGTGKNHVCICQYKLCHKPFIGNRMYCDDHCMRNANKARKTEEAKKKGEKNNG